MARDTHNGKESDESNRQRDRFGLLKHPDRERAGAEGLLISIGEGDPETVRETLGGRPHRRGTWVNVNVVLSTAEVARILLEMEDTQHETVADFVRMGLWRLLAYFDTQVGTDVQHDIPVPDEVWERAKLRAAHGYQRGDEPEQAFYSAMNDYLNTPPNYVRAGSPPSEDPLTHWDLPIDRGAEVDRDHKPIGTDDPSNYPEDAEE